MRLLDCKTLKLIEVFEEAAPTYAILSHTWGKEEVTFADITSSSDAYMHKQGWLKIQGAASTVIDKKYAEYIWIDTCCIDKSSSAELSEAINSMFRWYKKARICLAYLDDLRPEDLSFQDLMHRPESSQAILGKCRWFYRGWTLQELIAPHQVNFYYQDWSQVGVKTSYHSLGITTTLSQICGIPEKILDGQKRLSDVSVADRMSWASLRTTTRVEDEAYCLMGLFDVNMPLLYGEGRKAFQRLQHHIVQQTEDQSIFYWNFIPHLTKPWYAESPGLFALCPASFKGCGNVSPSSSGSIIPKDKPMTYTPRGMRMTLKLIDDDLRPGNLYAVLDIFDRDRPNIVFLLALRAYDDGVYERRTFVPPLLVSEGWHGFLQMRPERVYLRANISVIPPIRGVRLKMIYKGLDIKYAESFPVLSAMGDKQEFWGGLDDCRTGYWEFEALFVRQGSTGLLLHVLADISASEPVLDVRLVDTPPGVGCLAQFTDNNDQRDPQHAGEATVARGSSTTCLPEQAAPRRALSTQIEAKIDIEPITPGTIVKWIGVTVSLSIPGLSESMEEAPRQVSSDE